MTDRLPHPSIQRRRRCAFGTSCTSYRPVLPVRARLTLGAPGSQTNEKIDTSNYILGSCTLGEYLHEAAAAAGDDSK